MAWSWPFLSPRPKLPALPDLPGDLDAWLEASEALLPDIRPGAAKRIVWANPGAPGRTALALVYLHGFSADAMEIQPLCDQVAANLGANLFYTRLAGHGRTGAAMATASLQDWLDDTAEALAVGLRLGQQVVLVGCSTGGTLATIAAGALGRTGAHPQLARRLAATVLLAPNFGPLAFGSFLLTWPFAGWLAETLLGPERSAPAESDAHAAHWTLSYPTRALLPMAASVAMARRQPFRRMTTPLLAFYCDQDETVDPARIRKVLARWRAEPKMVQQVPAAPGESNHVIAGDIFAASRTSSLSAAISRFLEHLPQQQLQDQPKDQP